MTEIQQLRLVLNTRFVIMRWVYLLVGIASIGLFIFVEGQNQSSSVSSGPLMILFFITALFNLLLLFVSQYLESKETVFIHWLFSLFQILFDALVVTLVLVFLGNTSLVAPVLFFIPIAEAVVLFDSLGAVGVALLSGLALGVIYTGFDGLFNPANMASELLFGAVYLIVAIFLSYYSQLVKPFSLFAVKKNTENQHIAHDEQLQWVRKYGQKMEENNRRLYAKELELKLAKQELEALDQAKSKFISVTAHQMRTPLSAIRWTFNMLLSEQLGSLNDEQKKFLGQGSDSAEKMIAIVNDLLKVDHVETKWSDIKLDTIDITALVGNVVSEFSNQIASKKITFQVDKPASDIPKLEADPGKIRMVLENLLDNAIKYTKENGTITLAIKDDMLNSANHAVELTITDNGIGIPFKEQNKIFQKFFRATNAVANEPDGSGVGLFITKDIIDSHHGSLWFESKPGQGTTFHISLPIRQPDASGV